MSPGPISRLAFVLLLWGITTSCEKGDENPEPETPEQNTEIWNLEERGVPKFLEVYIQPEEINRISKFRSGVGHDYSDDFESCRSMKHYFDVPQHTEIRSPVKGELVWMQKEWAGHKLAIRSTEYPAFVIELFHVTLEGTLEVGALIEAGQLLGHHASGNTASDIAVMVQTDKDGPNENTLPRSNGIKLISYFDCINNQAMEAFHTGFRDGVGREGFIISKESRDSERFDCENDWQFGGQRSQYWVVRN